MAIRRDHNSYSKATSLNQNVNFTINENGSSDENENLKKGKKLSCILQLHPHAKKSNSFNIQATYYFGEFDTYNHEYSNIGILLKNSKYYFELMNH